MHLLFGPSQTQETTEMNAISNEVKILLKRFWGTQLILRQLGKIAMSPKIFIMFSLPLISRKDVKYGI